MSDKMNQFLSLNDDSATNFTGGTDKENIDKTELVSSSLGLGKNKLGRKKTTITISMETYQKLITLSVEHGETISDVAEKAIDKSLKNVKINNEYVDAFTKNDGAKRRDKVKVAREQIAKQK